MNQILAHYSISDFSGFKTAFDKDAENRGRNGLTLLQLWREAADSVWALYSVSDAARAREYLQDAAKVFESQAGVSARTIHMLETL